MPRVPMAARTEEIGRRGRDGPHLAIGLTPAHDEPLVALLGAAYGDPEREARAEVREYLGGVWGPVMAHASFVQEDEHGLCAAVLVCRFEGQPLAAHVLTRPDCQRRGRAEALLVRSARALHASGDLTIVLAVDAANQGALDLYARVGFALHPEPTFHDLDPAGVGNWARAERFGPLRARLAAAMPDFVPPGAYAVGSRGRDEPVTFPHVNVDGFHQLPALVLALVTGYRSGDATVVMTPRQLRLAISLLAPAEACTDFDHPNLAAWRQLSEELAGAPEEREVLAVFTQHPPRHGPTPPAGSVGQTTP